MDDLNEALTIIKKGVDPTDKWPTNCGHDELFVKGDWSKYTDDEIKRLDELGFNKIEDDEGGFSSFRFGSC